jgi:hypothetical protein
MPLIRGLIVVVLLTALLGGCSQSGSNPARADRTVAPGADEFLLASPAGENIGQGGTFDYLSFDVSGAVSRPDRWRNPTPTTSPPPPTVTSLTVTAGP